MFTEITEIQVQIDHGTEIGTEIIPVSEMGLIQETGRPTATTLVITTVVDIGISQEIGQQIDTEMTVGKLNSTCQRTLIRPALAKEM